MPGDKAFDTEIFRNDYENLRKRFRSLYQERMPVLRDYEKFANTQLDALIGETSPAAKQLLDTSRAASEQYQNEFLPASSDYLKSATEYDTPERRASERGKAMVDVGVAGDAAREASLQRLESYGIDPSMTRGAALDQNIRLDTALGQVKAANDKEMEVEERGRAYTRDALGVQAGLAGTAAGVGATGAGIMNNNVEAGNNRTALFADVFGTPQTNLAGIKSATDAKLGAKQYEQQAKVATQGPSTIGKLGSIAGTLGGAALGAYLGPAGSTAGAELGAQLGGQIGGSATGYN
jgi:hypothetical protein